MKLFIALFILMTTLPTLGLELSLVRSSNDNELWRIPEVKGSYLALTKKKNEKSFSLQGLEDESFIKKLEEDKKGMLSMMGISNWKVSKRNWQKAKGVKTLSLHGTYIDRSGSIIHFIEEHKYTKEITHQALLTIVNEETKRFEKALKTKFSKFSNKGQK